MITGELKSKVDQIWDTMWSGGISNPLSVIEQLTYLLFIKRLDEIQTLKERKAARTNTALEDPIFSTEQDTLRWSRFKDTAPEPMFEILRDEVFPFMKSLGDGTAGSSYTTHMKDAIFMMPSPKVLATVVDQLDGIDMTDSDTKGDLYEYMLGKIATAGQNGQFRTPRHIIQLMVEMTAPIPKDVICDPACGTAGFLIAASEHLVAHHSDTIYKDAAARRRFTDDTFHGYDFDPTMLRIGSMNMLLHGVENPDIRYRDGRRRRGEVSHPRQPRRTPRRRRRGEVFSHPRQSTLRRQPRLRVHRQGSAADRQNQEDGTAVPGAVPALAPDRRAGGDHRARWGAVWVEQGAQGPAENVGRRPEARRHRLHALGRVQTLRRCFDRHPALYQDELGRHRSRLVL